jgi:hypothetical protein
MPGKVHAQLALRSTPCHESISEPSNGTPIGAQGESPRTDVGKYSYLSHLELDATPAFLSAL